MIALLLKRTNQCIIDSSVANDVTLGNGIISFIYLSSLNPEKKRTKVSHQHANYLFFNDRFTTLGLVRAHKIDNQIVTEAK
jgi:hypothetical protein